MGSRIVLRALVSLALGWGVVQLGSSSHAGAALLGSAPSWAVMLLEIALIVAAYFALGNVSFRENAVPRPSASTGGPSSWLVDTSALVDGRIADVASTGFVAAELIVPQFVLDELQLLADSRDKSKRTRGRRGLDVLARLQSEPRTQVRLVTLSAEAAPGGNVDQRLVAAAAQLGARLLTQDFNLNKVAQLHGVAVVNLHELATALKPAYLPGETFELQILRPGEEASQGVGYLSDGTMVVVQDGRAHVDQTLRVTVTSVLQTSGGRMLFAKLAT